MFQHSHGEKKENLSQNFQLHVSLHISLSVQKHKIFTLSIDLGYENNVHLPKLIENADSSVEILYEKKSINFINDLYQIISEVSTSKAIPQLM